MKPELKQNLIDNGTHNLDNITRVEVIDKNGRSYVNVNLNNVKLAIQDNGETLKLFIDD